MAEREPLIVIKKIYAAEAGGHGGSWKVAFADFMTAMMAFFLLMWLLAQSNEVKKDVADYFSTPSVIEYNFSNYGVELTLEKLFLDLLNEPLKVFQTFIRPADTTPNFMAMGSKKVVLHQLADKLGEVANNVEVNSNEIKFELPAEVLFVPGTAKLQPKFAEVMENLRGITQGLEDSNIYIDSKIYYQSVKSGTRSEALGVATQRLDIVSRQIEASLEHETVDMFGRTKADSYVKQIAPGKSVEGAIKLSIKHKTDLPSNRKPRPLEDAFGSNKQEGMSVYDNFVDRLSNKKTQ